MPLNAEQLELSYNVKLVPVQDEDFFYFVITRPTSPDGGRAKADTQAPT